MKTRKLAHLDPKASDLDLLEELVEELTKQKPQEERIRAYMQNVGLEYTSDPIVQLSTILQALEGNPKLAK